MKKFLMSHMVKPYRIFYRYDTEANVWAATSEDIPGLVLEGEDLDRLKERVKEAIPELISINL